MAQHDNITSLRSWIDNESSLQFHIHRQNGNGIVDEKQQYQSKKESLLRSATVAYGIVELVNRARILADEKTVERGTRGYQNQEMMAVGGFLRRDDNDSRAESFDGQKKNIVANSHARNFTQSAKNETDEVGTHATRSHFLDPKMVCRCDNFQVVTSKKQIKPKWNNIRGMKMISPEVSLRLEEPARLLDAFCGEGEYSSENLNLGRYLETSIDPPLQVRNDETVDDPAAGFSQDDTNKFCNEIGVMFCELFSHMNSSENIIQPFSRIVSIDMTSGKSSSEPARKKSPQANASLSSKYSKNRADSSLPCSLCTLIKNLLDCRLPRHTRPDDAYSSLRECSADLHLILRDPEHFLFDNLDSVMEYTTATELSGTIPLRIREDVLYGREKEVNMIIETFCRVSAGKSEALFIGGYSGSGKTAVVKSVQPRVTAVGGYVISHKFDAISRGRSMSEVISIFNDLCLLIRDRNSAKELFEIVSKLIEVFGGNLSVLASLLPNIQALMPQFKIPSAAKESVDQMNFNSVCFTLQLFMRVVSSGYRPLMIFLDDLQWADGDGKCLDLIYSLLSDTAKGSCIFFVGSYRDNEINQEHAVFTLMAELDLCGVPSTTMRLAGLNECDLNAMLADSIRAFPRTTKSLSRIVYQKTNGNPYFVKAFLKSLVDRHILNYSLRERRWVWDLRRISSEDITTNVLYFLSQRMSALTESAQTALKVLSCFGIKVRKSIVSHLIATSRYPDFQAGLDEANEERLLEKSSLEYRFAHDRVREASHNIIPVDIRAQFHFDLGILLFSTTRGQELGEDAFAIADLINRGMQSPSSKLPAPNEDIADFFVLVATKALERADHVAGLSYLKLTRLFLPQDHWLNHYYLSIRLFCLLANAAYSCGRLDDANDAIQNVLKEGQSIEDKLDVYYVLVTLLMSSKRAEDAYSVCHEVLSQLDENIPASCDAQELAALLRKTNNVLNTMSDSELLGMKNMDSSDRLYSVLRFYSIMVVVAFFSKPQMMPFLTSRIVQISIAHGVCKHSVRGFVQYAAVLCSCKAMKDIPGACRIGRMAMAFAKQFNLSDPHIYYGYFGFVACHTEPLQACADMIRQGFIIGMQVGDISTAFFNAIQHIRLVSIYILLMTKMGTAAQPK